MNRPRLLPALVGALVLLGATGALTPISGARGTPPTTVGVRGVEFDLTFTSGTSKFAYGPALVSFYNAGEDPHDLKIQRVGDDTVYAIGVVDSLQSGEVSIPKLKPGATYHLWCSLEGHEAAGMAADLTVKERKKRHRHGHHRHGHHRR